MFPSVPPVDDPEDLARTLERRPPSANGTEEIALDDILEERPWSNWGPQLPARPQPASVAPPAPRPFASVRAASYAEDAGDPIRSRPRASIAPWVIGGVALGILVSLAVLVAVRLVEAHTPYARTSVTVVQTSTPSRPPADDPDRNANLGPPTVALDSLPFVAPTRGTLMFPAQAHGHRVFVDGAVVGQSDAPLEVRCGTHEIRIGSRGEAQTVSVPCGGEVTVSVR